MPYWIKFGQILNVWLRTFSFFCHVCYSLSFIRYFIVGFRCGVEFCLYNWKEKSIIWDMRRVLKGMLHTPTYNFFTIPSSPVQGWRNRASLLDLWHFSQVNLLYFCLTLKRLHFPFSHGFDFGLIIFKTKCSRSLTKLQPTNTQFSKMFYLKIKLL